MPHRLQFGFGLLLLMAGTAVSAPPPAASNTLTAVRFWTLGDTTRVVIETSAETHYKQDRVPDPDRLFFDFADTTVKLNTGKRHGAFTVGDPRLKQIRVAETQPGVARVVFDLGQGVEFSASRLNNPPRLIVELKAAPARTPQPQQQQPPVVSSVAPPPATSSPVETAPPPSRVAAAPAVEERNSFTPPPARTATEPPASEPVLTSDTAPQLPAKTASPAAIAAATPPANTAKTPQAKLPPPPKPAKTDGSHSMTRVLGLKVGRIVLDPGHGGHDTGTIGPNGLYEKDLVLDIAQRLGELIESRLGAEVVFTRSDDTFIPLEKRTAIANDQKADLFLSIHANSSPLAATSGVETYYLNFTESKQALEIAARENAGSSRTVYDLKDLIQKIALHDKIEESRQFASRIQSSLHAASMKANPRSRDRGVRKAPFVVLIGASMPSVLAEIGFVTNPKDESMFRKQDYRQKVAEGLYQGLARYAGTLSQFQVAQN
jgi:N-acetylmuramoyl-L-alanine amidase